MLFDDKCWIVCTNEMSDRDKSLIKNLFKKLILRVLHARKINFSKGYSGSMH
jgi:hypothetical protein